MAAAIPVVRVIGPGRNVGKTWLAERLITWFTAHGYEVLAVKRSHHTIAADRPGTDSDRFAQAGAAVVVFGGSDGTLARAPHAEHLDEITARFAGTADLAIVEGFTGDRLGAQLEIFPGPPAAVHLTATNGGSVLTAPLEDIETIARGVVHALQLAAPAETVLRPPTPHGA